MFVNYSLPPRPETHANMIHDNPRDQTGRWRAAYDAATSGDGEYPLLHGVGMKMTLKRHVNDKNQPIFCIR